jgi:hypothetical protein
VNKTGWIIALLSLLALVAACQDRGGKAATSTATETIAPPAPQPAPTGTDAMTQTVDIEDSRSEDDGGVLTSAQTAKVPGSATAATSTTASKTTTKKKTKK